jgi:3-hydroxypropanoate dehydrogenase
MATPNGCIDRLFRDARTHNAWLDKPVGDETLRELYNALNEDRPARMPRRPVSSLFASGRARKG